MAYPIEVPPGRQGMQPELRVNYNSSGGNGWLGVGWDLQTPSIVVDTRWGVPRYRPDKETETYLLDGAQLTPVAHRGPLRDRASDTKSFHARVEGEFLRIVRKGDAPNNYTWEITDKSGTKYLYGASADAGLNPALPGSASTLTDDSGNIFEWALREVRDLHGNSVRYHHVRVVARPGDQSMARGGRNLYLDRIEYTGHPGHAAPYEVTFHRSTGRVDTTIDARGGFKRVTADLLKEVEVRYDPEGPQSGDGAQLVRRYEFEYEEPSIATLFKTRLRSIAQLDAAENLVAAPHTFEYHDDIAKAGGNPFGPAETEERWNACDDRLGNAAIKALTLGAVGGTGALNGNSSVAGGGHVYVGVGAGAVPSKGTSAGLKFGFNHADDEGLLALMDVDGDNLPDKVFRDGGVIRYRKNLSGPGGEKRFDCTPVAPALKQADGSELPGIYKETSNTINFGLEGYGGSIAGAQANYVSTFTETGRYFSDVNGDGIADLVDGGRVLFGRTTGESHLPVYGPSSADTPLPVEVGQVAGDELLTGFEQERELLVSSVPLLDTVRVWRAPFDGEVRVEGAVTLGSGAPGSPTADGVRVAIQHEDTELWAARIHPGDSAAHTPQDVSTIQVRRGEHLYFRVQSIEDITDDKVGWDPKVSYNNQPDTLDVNGLPVYRYQASEDFTLAGRDGYIEAPLTGTMRLSGTFVKRGRTTDDLTLEVTREGEPVFRRTLAADEVTELPLDALIDVQLGQKLAWHVKVDSPVDLRQFGWRQDSQPGLGEGYTVGYARAHYVSAVGVDEVNDDQGRPLFVVEPPVSIDVYPLVDSSRPQDPFVVPADGELVVQPLLNIRTFPPPFPNHKGGRFTFTVKTRDGLLDKRHIDVPAGAGAPDIDPFKVQVSDGERLYFDFSSLQPDLARAVQLRLVGVRLNGGPTVVAPSAVHHPVEEAAGEGPKPYAAGSMALPQPYRGWGAIGYNGEGDRAAQPLVQADLLNKSIQDSLPKEKPTEDQQRAFEETPVIEPPKAVPFVPTATRSRYDQDKGFVSTQVNQWGTSESSWVSADAASSSRLGGGNIQLPAPGDLAGVTAVPRLSHSEQISLSAGVAGAGLNHAGGASNSDLDYLDLNGDQFPDVVTPQAIQYTEMTGALASDRTLGSYQPGGDPVQLPEGGARKSANVAGNISLGSAGRTIATGAGRVTPPASGTANSARSGSDMAPFGPLGPGANYGKGSADAKFDLLDVNGDGLPDRAYDDGHVRLNLGYRFDDMAVWPATPAEGGDTPRPAALNAGETVTGGANIGFNTDFYGFAGGASYSQTTSFAKASLADVTGDGLLDRVIDGNPIQVSINTGTGFSKPRAYPGSAPGINVDTNAQLGGGVYFTTGFCIVVCLVVNPGGDFTSGVSRAEQSLRDVDGDGYADHVRTTSDGTLVVRRNQTGRTNLLKAVHRSLGATIRLDYARSGNTYDQPQSRWVLSRSSVYDGHPGDGVDIHTSRFDYTDGVYDRKEREFLGFGRVTTTELNGQQPVRSTVRDYDTSSVHGRGLLTRERVIDDQGRTFTEIANTYKLRDLETGQVVDLDTKLAGRAFPMLERTDVRNFEGGASAGTSTFTTYAYDNLGNVTETVDGGDTNDPDDDVASRLTYSECPDSYLSTAIAIVSEARGKTVRERRSDVECATGEITQVRAYLANGDAATSDMTYTPEGNLDTFTGPPTASGPGYKLTYEYDDIETRSMVTAVKDSFGLRSTTKYDARFGVPTRVADQAGQATTFTLDDAGRLIQVFGPYQQGGSTPTLEFDYQPFAEEPWALTKAIPPAGKDTLDTVVIVDGLGRTIQTKTDSAVLGPDTGIPDDVRVVSGHQEFDGLGRAVAVSYPTIEPLSSPVGDFNPAVDQGDPQRTAFDVLDRPTKVVNPDGATTTTSFGFDEDRDGTTRLVIAVTDAQGTTTRSYTDGQGQTTGLLQTHTLPGGGQQLLWNSASYDPLGQLEWLTDAKGNETTFGYDNLGRRTSLTSPDAGRVDSTYDLASNLVEQVTPTLREQNSKITYRYEFGRLTGIDYPLNSGNNVTYTYGDSKAGLEAGRLLKVTDESGTHSYRHGRLGEVTQEIRAISSKTGALPETYTTRYQHDTFGRLLNMTYPDGETITYSYDSGGQPARVDSTKGGWHYRYVSQVGYDKFGQRVLLVGGNNVTTSVSFDPVSRRLASITSGLPGKPANQNLKYTYDKVGNVTSVVNEVPVVAPNAFGGPMTQIYAYDDLHRLVRAEGTYVKPPDQGNRYTLTLEYDELNNVISKSQRHDRISSGGQVVPQQKTTRSWDYAYDGVVPHAPDVIGDRTYKYNEAGQQTGWTSQHGGNRRTVTWDEEGRIQTVVDNGAQRKYAYDHSGTRVVKQGPEGETVYVSPSFSIRNREVGQKDIFLSGARIATKLMKQQKPGGQSSANPYEKDIYYAHADHLGSTEFVTDLNGSTFQHFEYFPSGEPWIREDSNINRTNYMFTGKELDEETGLYYYEARYYDPQTGQFLSTDPLLESEPGAGMENPQFLALYTYANNNPLRYTDPTGAEPRPSVFSSQYWRNVWAGYQWYANDLDARQRAYDTQYEQAYAEESARTPLIVKMFGGSSTEDPVATRTVERIGPRPANILATIAETYLNYLLLAGSVAPKQVPASAAPKVGWSVGDDIYSLTRAGNTPAWSTVRARFWKNEAANPQYGSWTETQLTRMRRGLAPQRYNPDKGGMESMDLSHEPIPYRDGGRSVTPRWPQDHAAIDPYRYPGY